MRFTQLFSPGFSRVFNNYLIGFSIVSDAESQASTPQAASAPNSSPARGKPSNKSLIVLAILFALSGLSVALVPQILQEIFYQEEEAKRDKNAVIVGTRTDLKPPPGLSNPFAGMPPQQGGTPSEGGDDSGTEKAADSAPK
jgi:hypothetical protein